MDPTRPYISISTSAQINNIADQSAVFRLQFATLIDSLNKGTRKYEVGINNSDEVIPPFGPPLYTPGERLEKIKRLLVISDEIPLGCSTLFDLFSDAIAAGVQDCLKHGKFNPKERIQLYDINQKPQTYTKKELIWIYYSTIEADLGRMAHIGRRGGNWHHSLGLQHGINIVKNQHTSQALFDSLDAIDDHVQFSNLKHGRQLIEIVHLYKDVLFQEMHKLFEPIDSNPTYANHFRRLKFRLNWLQNYVVKLEDLLPNSIKQNDTYLRYFREDRKWILKICESLNSLVTSIAEKEHPTPKEAVSLYLTILDIQKSCPPCSKLYDKLIIDKNHIDQKYYSSSNKEAIDSNLSRNLLTKLDWTLDTIFSESTTVVLRELLEINQITIQEMDECLENIIDAIHTIETISVENINQLFLFFKTKENSKIIQDLENWWNNDFLYIRKYLIKGVLDLLEERKKRCKQEGSTIWDRVLALRDVANECKISISNNLHNINLNLDIITSTHSKHRFDINLLINALYNCSEIYRKTIAASINGVESLLGRCFVKAEAEEASALQIAEAQAKERLLNSEALIKEIESKTKTKRKKKKKKVKKPIPTAPQEVKKRAPAIFPKLKLEKLPEAKISLESIQKGISEFTNRGLEDAFRLHWRNAQLSNLEGWTLRMEEIGNIKSFDCANIFNQTDILRRMVEAALEIAIAQYLPENVIPESHHLHLLVRTIINDTIPGNVRNVIWQLRQIPYELSQANECVNYMHSTFEKIKFLPEQAVTLIKFLQLVEKENKASDPNTELRLALNNKHNELVRRGLYFVKKLIEAMNDPEKGIEGVLPSNITMGASLDLEMEEEPLSLNSPSILTSPEEFIAEEVVLKPIQDRKEALESIDNALAWIAIRCLNPVEGYIDIVNRTKLRNLALKNASLYLHRLRGVLSHNRIHRPYDTVCSEISLVQRAHKELIIAVLFHGSYYEHGMHVIDRDNLRYNNDPCYLMKVLKSLSQQKKELPQLPLWMSVVHRAISYTASKTADENNTANELRGQLLAIRNAAAKRKEFTGGFTVVGEHGMERTSEEYMSQIRQLIDQEEINKIFPALSGFLHILKSGITIKKSYFE